MAVATERTAVELPLDHVAIAVPSLDAFMPIFESVMGARGSNRTRVESQGVDVAFLGAGAVQLELIEPLTTESPVGRFLERRGPGLHHVGFRVLDLDATLAHFAATDIELIDREPRIGAHGRRIAFLHPRSTGGVLVELVEAV